MTVALTFDTDQSLSNTDSVFSVPRDDKEEVTGAIWANFGTEVVANVLFIKFIFFLVYFIEVYNRNKKITKDCQRGKLGVGTKSTSLWTGSRPD